VIRDVDALKHEMIKQKPTPTIKMSAAAVTTEAKGEKKQVVELVEDDDEFEEFETGS
jgi:hypothetical protein